MAQKLYVGGLPYSTTDQELADAFAQAGTVTSASIVTDRMTGRSRGFGFVEMASEADAEAAINMWNGPRQREHPLSICGTARSSVGVRSR